MAKPNNTAAREALASARTHTLRAYCATVRVQVPGLKARVAWTRRVLASAVTNSPCTSRGTR